MDNILTSFPISNDEYSVLDSKFGDLCEFAAWQLCKKNSRNNHTDEQQDISQELRFAMITAGSYFKRQVFIERCLELCSESVDDPFLKKIVDNLQDLWKNKTRHGANKQKFGCFQEKLLERITKKNIPPCDRPSKKAPLRMNSKFTTYCKSIAWNRQKAIGKKITREKPIRTGQVSLSEFDYFIGC